MFFRVLCGLAVLGLALSLGACGSSKTAARGDEEKKPAAETREKVSVSGKGADIVRTARSYLGTPYKYGGKSRKTGFDCSGLVYRTYRRNGLAVPRTSVDQSRYGRAVSAPFEPGDVLFFEISSGKWHSGIYAGDDIFVHAPSSGGKVREDRLDSPYWKQTFVRARRYL